MDYFTREYGENKKFRVEGLESVDSGKIYKHEVYAILA